MKSEVEEFLDETYKTKTKVPMIVEKPPRIPRIKKSKIELMGPEIGTHLMELARNTDLSYNQMARRINELYKPEESKKITKKNVVYFFQHNKKALIKLAEEKKSLSKIRANLYLEHNQVLTKDIKKLDDQVTALLEDETLETDKRAKAIGELLDKKGRLLLRHARLSGTLKEEKKTTGNIENIEKVQVNIFQQANEEKSEIMAKLKKAEFKEEEEIIDVTKTKENANKKRDP